MADEPPRQRDDGDPGPPDDAPEGDRRRSEDPPTTDDRTDGRSDEGGGPPADPQGADGGPAGPDDSGAAAGDAEAPESPSGGPDDDGPPLDGGGVGDVPEDVRKYERFKKVDGAQYDRVNEFLRERTYVTAREWAIARLCADFRTETGVEMTKIGENLPRLVPFMEDTYTPQAVNQARASFEEKVRTSGATFLYGAMSGFLTAEELDELMYEVTEVAKFLLEVEGVELDAEAELAAEDRVSEVMREVREASEGLRHGECPHCGESLQE